MRTILIYLFSISFFLVLLGFFVSWMAKEIYKNIPQYQQDSGADVAFITYSAASAVIFVLVALVVAILIDDYQENKPKKNK